MDKWIQFWRRPFDWLRAAGIGGLVGGIGGGILGGINAVSNGGNFWSGKGSSFHSVVNRNITFGDPVKYSNESAQAFSDEYFGDVSAVDNLYADGRLGINEKVTDDG